MEEMKVVEWEGVEKKEREEDGEMMKLVKRNGRVIEEGMVGRR